MQYALYSYTYNQLNTSIITLSWSCTWYSLQKSPRYESVSSYLMQLSVTSGLVRTLLSTSPLLVSRLAKHPLPSPKDIHEQTLLHGFTVGRYFRFSRGHIIIIIYCTYKATTVLSHLHIMQLQLLLHSHIGSD